MVNKNKILIVSQHYWPESFRVNDISDYFIEKNCEVDVLCGIPNYPTGKIYDGYSHRKNRRQLYREVSIFRSSEIPRGKNTNLRIFLNYISFPVASLFRIPRLLTRRHDKVFIYQTSPVLMAFTGILLSKIKRVESVMYVLDLWPENLYSVYLPKYKFLRWTAEKVSHWHYKHVDRLVVLSTSMKDKLKEVTGLPDEKISIIPQACEEIYGLVSRDRTLENKFKGSFNVVFAGNISPAQSFKTIIEAAKILNKGGSGNVKWIIVGDGMSRKWLEEEVTREGLLGSFSFEGQKPVNDIPKYTGIADVLVGCLVKSELLEATIPAKVMSYIAAGKPIVLSMDGEAKELVEKQAKCGYVGPTEDANALALNIQKIIKMDSAERRAMGKRGKTFHENHLSRDILLTKLYDFMFRE